MTDKPLTLEEVKDRFMAILPPGGGLFWAIRNKNGRWPETEHGRSKSISLENLIGVVWKTAQAPLLAEIEELKQIIKGDVKKLHVDCFYSENCKELEQENAQLKKQIEEVEKKYSRALEEIESSPTDCFLGFAHCSEYPLCKQCLDNHFSDDSKFNPDGTMK